MLLEQSQMARDVRGRYACCQGKRFSRQAIFVADEKVMIKCDDFCTKHVALKKLSSTVFIFSSEEGNFNSKNLYSKNLVALKGASGLECSFSTAVQYSYPMK